MADKETKKENQRLYYEQYVKEANSNLKSNHESQDKMILAISVAVFGLMSLLKELQTDYCVKILIVLLLSFNVFSLISVLLSFWLCAKGIEEDKKYIEEYYLEFKDESFYKQSCYTKGGKLCNTLSLIFIAITLTILAIILGMYFFSKG